MMRFDSISNAWLRIESGLIADFGSMSDLNTIPAGFEVLDVRGHWVFPAFCDPHTHLVFAATREAEFVSKLQGMSYEEIAANGGGILNSAKRLQDMDEERLFELSAERLAQAVAAGVGAMEIKSGYGLTLEDELKMLRVIARLKASSPCSIKATCLGLHALPLDYRGRKDEYVRLVIDRLLPEAAASGLVDFVDVFCEQNYFSIADMLAVIEAGSRYGLKAKVHVNQFNAFGGVAAAVGAGALSVDHLEVMMEEDFKALEHGQTIPTALPGCSFYLRIPYTPARQIIDRGLPLAIASDYNPGSSPSLNPELNLSLACIQLRMLPEEALNACTINAAAAMDLSGQLGSIEQKKKANLVLTRALPSLAYWPYAFGEKCVEKTMLNGDWI